MKLCANWPGFLREWVRIPRVSSLLVEMWLGGTDRSGLMNSFCTTQIGTVMLVRANGIGREGIGTRVMIRLMSSTLRRCTFIAERMAQRARAPTAPIKVRWPPSECASGVGGGGGERGTWFGPTAPLLDAAARERERAANTRCPHERCKLSSIRRSPRTQTDTPTDNRQTDRQADRQTDRQTDKFGRILQAFFWFGPVSPAILRHNSCSGVLKLDGKYQGMQTGEEAFHFRHIFQSHPRPLLNTFKLKQYRPS